MYLSTITYYTMYTKLYIIAALTGTPSTPVLTYKSTYNEILVSWSPVGSDGVCGPVTYNITVMPSHGMMMMINNTVYNITGLNYNTNYIITVYATNSHGGHGENATVTVRTLPGTYLCNDMLMHSLPINNKLQYRSNATSHMQVPNSRVENCYM